MASLYNDTDQITCLDAYGNLTADGTNTYDYDAANRLASVSDGVSTSTYTYNGDGDRVAQTVDSVETTYVLDVATPLTMVLSETTTVDDGINPPVTEPTLYYLHGLGLVAESDGASTDYFLNDGLGSVRQLTGPAANPLLAQTFDPYGNLYASAGASTSAFGYTGEYQDASGLLYLRARYYNSAQGRFLNMDPSRRERNPYQYASSNPIVFVDPSGNICIKGVNRKPYWFIPCKQTDRQNASDSPPPSSQDESGDFWERVAQFLEDCFGEGDNNGDSFPGGFGPGGDIQIVPLPGGVAIEVPRGTPHPPPSPPVSCFIPRGAYCNTWTFSSRSSKRDRFRCRSWCTDTRW